MAYEPNKSGSRPEVADVFGAQRELARIVQDQIRATFEATEALMRSRSPSDMIEIQRSWFIDSVERGAEQFRICTEAWRGTTTAFTQQAESMANGMSRRAEETAERTADAAKQAAHPVREAQPDQARKGKNG